MFNIKSVLYDFLKVFDLNINELMKWSLDIYVNDGVLLYYYVVGEYV